VTVTVVGAGFTGFAVIVQGEVPGEVPDPVDPGNVAVIVSPALVSVVVPVTVTLKFALLPSRTYVHEVITGAG
jgi:hypothetical protein